MAQVRIHRFVEPTGEAHELTLDELEDVIHSIWRHGRFDLPYQLVDELDGTVVLRFARSMPEEVALDVFEDEVDLDQVIAFVVVAVHEKTEWTLCWAMPVLVEEGPGELFYLGPDGVRLSPEDMRKIR